MRETPPVAVGRGRALAQLNRLSRQHGSERSARRVAGVRAHPGLAAARRQRHFNAGKADFPAILERKAAPVGNRAHPCGPDRLRATGISGGHPGLRKSARERPCEKGGEAEPPATPRCRTFP